MSMRRVVLGPYRCIEWGLDLTDGWVATTEASVRDARLLLLACIIHHDALVPRAAGGEKQGCVLRFRSACCFRVAIDQSSAGPDSHILHTPTRPTGERRDAGAQQEERGAGTNPLLLAWDWWKEVAGRLGAVAVAWVCDAAAAADAAGCWHSFGVSEGRGWCCWCGRSVGCWLGG